MTRPEVHQWPTPTEWKREVKAKLKDRGRGAHSWLAREIGISTGHLSELLGPEGRRSEHVPKISKLLDVEWSPPIASVDVPEIRHVLRRMTPRQQRQFAEYSANMSDEAFTEWLDSILRLAALTSGVAQKKK